MKSLRSRQSQAPPRKGQKPPAKLAKTTGNGPRDNIQRKGTKLDDRIKKRMSMRYADISSPTELTGIPALPSIPAGIEVTSQTARLRDQEEAVRDRSLTKADLRVVQDDKKLLNQTDFDPDAFLKLKMANSTEAEIKSLQSSLRSAKEDTASDLQRTVFKNYAELVVISKEISTLENEMLELKDSLSEYKSMPSLLNIPDPTNATNSSTMSTFRRSSVADLRIMYYNQMQTLHAQIEGSAKFAPTTPGRHVIGEIDNILALNPATFKAIGKVKFVVLDDAVLVAKRRRRTGGTGSDRRGGSISEGKLVAERCWPIREMLVLDTKDTATMTNVFKIKHNKETHVYRTETLADKKSLLVQFRQVAEELSAKKRKEREGEHERRKSMWTAGAGGAAAPPMPDWMADLAAKAGDVSSDAKNKMERDSKWLNEWADELTVAIALREWEKAVQLVEEGKRKTSIIQGLPAKLSQLTSQLTSSLISSLSLQSNRRSTVIALSAWLQRLGAGAAARSAFLNMRSAVLKSLVRKIRFEGHVGAYIGDLAVVYFTCIKHTADWFLASFKDNEVASSFIEWARQEIVNYCEMFRKQVYPTEDADGAVVKEAKQITYTQSKKLLQEYGLDFRFLFEELLEENPSNEGPSKTPLARIDTAAFRARSMPKAEAPITPSPTPTSKRSRSPAPPVIQIPEAPPVSTMPRSRRPSAASSTTSSIPHSALPSAQVPSAIDREVTSSPLVRPGNVLGATPPSPTLSTSSRVSSSSRSGRRTPIIGPPSGTEIPPMPQLVSPSPLRTKTPPPSATSPLPPRERPPTTFSISSVSTSASGDGKYSLRGPRAPPPRSLNRTPSGVSTNGTGHRPPPVAVPQREGMF